MKRLPERQGAPRLGLRAASDAGGRRAMMARERREARVTVDILCKVVDNYGDIGVVYRLAKALSALDPALKIRLSVDNLAALDRKSVV